MHVPAYRPGGCGAVEMQASFRQARNCDVRQFHLNGSTTSKDLPNLESTLKCHRNGSAIVCCQQTDWYIFCKHFGRGGEICRGRHHHNGERGRKVKHVVDSILNVHVQKGSIGRVCVGPSRGWHNLEEVIWVHGMWTVRWFRGKHVFQRLSQGTAVRFKMTCTAFGLHASCDSSWCAQPFRDWMRLGVIAFQDLAAELLFRIFLSIQGSHSWLLDPELDSNRYAIRAFAYFLDR